MKVSISIFVTSFLRFFTIRTLFSAYPRALIITIVILYVFCVIVMKFSVCFVMSL